jgi:aspartate/methionine/tyrosine aminotransferase
MQLPPFLLEHWLEKYQNATPPIRFNLGSSTGPPWTFGELLALDPGFDAALRQTRLTYAPGVGSPALRNELAELSGVDADAILVTTGASEATSVLLCLAAAPGVNVVLPDAAFPAFGAVAGAWGLAVKTYGYRRDDAFRFSVERVLATVDERTRLVLVNTPHNPTGSVATRADVAALAGALAERGIPLVVDEVYHPLYHGAPVPSAAGLDNVIVVGDFSKALSLPGLRTGWIVDLDAKRRARALDAREYFTVSGSPVLEAVAAHALRHRETIFARAQKVTSANVSAFGSFVEQHRERLAWVPPRGGTVAFPWFVDRRDSRAFCTALAANGVLVVPGDCFGAPEHVRVGFGALTTGFADALLIMDRTLRAH